MLTNQLLKKSEDGIDGSDYYLALITDNFLKDELCSYQWNYAKSKEKRFVLVIKRGVKIPDEMMKGVNVFYTTEYETEKDIEEIGNRMKDILKEDIIGTRGKIQKI